jgi:hypothetical protein
MTLFGRRTQILRERYRGTRPIRYAKKLWWKRAFPAGLARCLPRDCGCNLDHLRNSILIGLSVAIRAFRRKVPEELFSN